MEWWSASRGKSTNTFGFKALRVQAPLPAPLIMNQYQPAFSERRLRKYEKLGNFTIEPWGERFYALYDGYELVCVTVYKKGALEVMKRLTEETHNEENGNI